MPSVGGHGRPRGADAWPTCAYLTRAYLTRAWLTCGRLAWTGVAVVLAAHPGSVRGRGRPRLGSPARCRGGSSAPSHVPLVSIGIDAAPDRGRNPRFT